MKPEYTGQSGQPYHHTARDNVPQEDENKWVSIETGEEFSERFLREGVSPRRAHEQAVSGQIDDFSNHAATNYSNSEQPSTDYFVHSPASTLSRKPSDYFVNSPCYQKVEEDTNYKNSEQQKKIGFDVLKRIDSGSRRDLSDFAPRESSFDATRSYMMSNRSEQQKLLVFDRCVSDVSVQYLASPYLHQQSEYVPGFSDNPSLGKMKILCSFGGRILPRPNDGKLRYVGGETKIISIRNHLTYNDLVKKTTAICNLPHTIKYQLPGEELDVLISVSSDEDLRHMTEEYYDLEATSKRVRIFLIPLSDLETPCSSEARTGQQVDSDYHYVAAVNGMLDHSYHRSSSKESLTSPVEGSNWNISRNVAGESPSSRNLMENRNRSSYFRPNLEIQNLNAQFIDTPQVPSASFIASSTISPAKFQQREREGSHTSVLEAVRMNDINVHSKENTSAHSHRPNDYFVNSHASAHSHRPSDYFLNSPASAHSRRPSDVFVNSPASSLSRKPSEYFVNSPASTLSRKPSEYFVNSPASTLSRNPSDCFVNSPASTLSRNPSDCFVSSPASTLSRKPSDYFVNSPASTLSRKPSDYFLNSPASTLSRKPSDYFVNSPCYEKVEEDTKPPVPAVQSGSILPSQDTFSKSPITDIVVSPVSPCHRKTQEVPKSHLQIDGSPNVILENKTNQSPNEVQMEESALATIPLRDCLFQPWANYEANFRGDNNENLQNLVRQEKNEELIQWNDDKVRLTDTNNNGYLSNNTAFEHNFHVSKEFLHHQHFPVTPKFIGTPNFLENTSDTRRNHAGDFVLRPEVSDILVDALRESTDQLPAMIMNKGYHDAHRDGLHGSDKIAKEYPLSFNFNHPFDNDLSLPDSAKCTALVRADTVSQRAAQEPDQNIMVNHAECVMNIINYSYNKSDLRDEMLIHSQPAIKNHDAKLPDTHIIIEDVTDSSSLEIPSNCTIVPLVCDEESYVVSSNTEEADEKSPISQTEYEDNKDDSINDAVIFETEAGKYGLQIIENADLEDLHELGSGTYGTVFHGKWRGTDVAIKRIKRSCFVGRSSEQERLIKDVWREAQILSKIHHPNIVAFYGVVPDGPGGTLATVTEFMVDGSLRLALLKKDRTLDQRKKLMIALDAAFGMEYLHLKNIVHFDLKCDNLLVNLGDPQRPVCKVGDFGLSRIKRNTLVSGGIRGTLPWMAPELLNGSSNRVSEKVDVFSFGITMWEILTSDEPYANMHCGEIIGGIVNNTLRPPIPKRCNAEWKILMEECWSHDPAKRPSFTKITNRLRDMLKTLHPKGVNRVRR